MARWTHRPQREKGDLILWRDTTPGPGELTAGKDEEALPIALDGLQIDPRLLRVGDEIGFLIDATPAISAPAGTAMSARPQPRTVIEYAGPFRILTSSGKTLILIMLSTENRRKTCNSVQKVGVLSEPLSVGDVVQRRAPDQKDTSSARTITVALKRKGDRIENENMRKFLEAKWAARERQQQRILEVVLRPRQLTATTTK